jgi:hypothetical protein
LADQTLEKSPLATMRPDITGVKKPTASYLDQERIGIKGRVVDQVGRNREWTDFYLGAVSELDCVAGTERVRHKRRRGLQNAARCSTHCDRDAWVRDRKETPMVYMAMGQYNSAKARAGAIFEPRYVRQQSSIFLFGTEWFAEVDHDALAAVGQLDARSADLVSPPMNARPKTSRSSWWIIVDRF